MSLTHFNKKNKNTEMVDISNKNKSQRIAIAKGEMIIDKSLYDYLLKNKKITNNLFNTSKISGVLAAKNTSNVIPLTHNIPIDYIDIKIELKNNTKINIIAEAKSHYSTGIEIEVIHAVAVTATTLYDMLKSYKKTIIINISASESKLPTLHKKNEEENNFELSKASDKMENDSFVKTIKEKFNATSIDNSIKINKQTKGD